MKSEQVNLSYLSFLSTPPTSSRTEISIKSGGSTTRRSLQNPPKDTFNGKYEGDFTMSDETIKDITYKSANSSYNRPVAVDQFLGENFDLALEQHEEHLDDEIDEIVDEEIRGKTVELKLIEKPIHRRNYWKEYKHFVFTREQAEKIELFIDKVKQNDHCRKIFFAMKCITVLTIWILRLLFFSVVMRVVELSCSALRSRSILRSGTRRLLWYMTLAKCGDLQLYGIILLLSPLLFLIAFLGFICSLYYEIKNVIFVFIGYVRHRLDVEPPKFD